MNAKPHKITTLSSRIIMLSHMMTDISQGAFPSLVPIIQKLYLLNYSQIGLLVFLQSLTSSICQPLFGIISDKKPRAWFIPAGVVLSGVAMGCIVWAPNYTWLIILIALSGFGSAIFHPQAMKTANRISPQKTKGKNIAFFSVGGNLGFAIGAFITGILLSLNGGFKNVIWIALPSVLLIPFLIATYKNLSLASQVGEKSSRKSGKGEIPYKFLAVLLTYIFMRSAVQSGINTYTPLYHVNYLGQNSIFTGNYLSVFSIFGVLGTYLGGVLSDKYGRKTIIAGSMLLSVPLVYLIPYVQGLHALIVAALTGMVIVASFSPTLAMAQESMKNNMALAGGLTTGFAIGLGGVGATLLGKIADKVTLPLMLHWLFLLPLAAVAVTFFLPGKYGQNHMVNQQPAVADESTANSER